MKHLVFSFSDTQEYAKAYTKARKKKYTSQLVQVFCGIREKKKIAKILEKLHEDFPHALIVGATTAGEIMHASMRERDVVVSLSLFENTKLNYTYVKEIDTASAHTIAKTVFTKNTKAAVVLSEGLYGKDYEGFIRELRRKHKGVIISGGMAGDNFALKKTFIFVGTHIYDTGAVSVSFSSKKLFAKNHYNLNWEPIGKHFRITEVAGNTVKKIDNLSAVAFFKKYLGEDVFKEDAKSLPDFQLLYKEGDTFVSRTPMAREGDALVFAAPLREGQKVQFGFSNAASVLSGSEYISKKLDTQPAEGIYIYSCIARKTLIGNLLEKEFSYFENIAPTAGFFTYGEFYSTEADNALLNCTTTILVLSEKAKVKGMKKAKKRLKNVDMSALENVTFGALTHFIKQTSIELDENIRLMKQYQNVVDASSLVSKTDTEGIITYVNENFAKISGYTTEELLGQPHNIVRDKKVSSKLFKKMWETISAGKVWRGTFSNRAKSGKRYFVDATIMPIFDNEGRISEYIAIRQDITKQVYAKRRIQEKERLIKAIFDNQDSIVVLASKETGMKNVNKKFFEYFDYESFEDFKARHTCICDLFMEEEGYVNNRDMPEWLEQIARDDTRDYKVKIKTKDGSVRIFTIKIKSVEDDYIINLNDITSLEEALLKAYASEQAKSAFLANMSHEIRTPLNGILGFTDLLMQKELESGVKKYVEIIHKSGKTLLSVVNDILDFSKLESGEFALYEMPVNLYEELEASVSTFASLSKTKKVNYFAYVDSSLPKLLKCDAQRIKQVLNNLVSNAIKFTPEGGDVKVCISMAEKVDGKARIHFSVKDTGVGIEEEKISTIFQAFSQEDNSISREFGGTGLGLSISNQFIQMMGSQIEVKSKKGEGSEFYFDLELEIVDEDTAFGKKHVLDGLSIGVLKQSREGECQVLDIIHKYFKEWEIEFTEFSSLTKMPKELDVLIAYAPFVESGFCKAILESNPKLQIVYMENANDSLVCEHERFYSIAQPMTGSDLFDALISKVNLREQLKTQEAASAEVQHFGGTVLVAEDNLTNQMLITALLEARGVECDVVENGQKALEVLLDEKKEYDLVFMDINMPVMDGISATKKLREAGYAKPIVSLSANVIESDTKAFREAGMDDTLNKPIVPAELDAILQKYLTTKQKEADEEERFDAIEIAKLSEELSINEQVIRALLRTLKQSFEDALQKLGSGELDKSLAHSIKGVSGNMRLTHLQKLASEIEQKVEDVSAEEREHFKTVLQKHLEHILKEIGSVTE